MAGSSPFTVMTNILVTELFSETFRKTPMILITEMITENNNTTTDNV